MSACRKIHAAPAKRRFMANGRVLATRERAVIDIMLPLDDDDEKLRKVAALMLTLLMWVKSNFEFFYVE